MNQLQTDFKVDRSAMSDVEWDLRVQLAAAYRLVEHFGWTELIYGHLTVRVPGAEPHFLINPFGLNYDEIKASNLVKIDVDGNESLIIDGAKKLLKEKELKEIFIEIDDSIDSNQNIYNIMKNYNFNEKKIIKFSKNLKMILFSRY